MGLGAVLVGGAIVRGIGGPLAAAVKTAGDFQAAINFTAVLAQVKRGSDAFLRLAETAKELGRTTQFTAVQAAGGLQFLAKAGLDADEAISAIPETLKIAAIGQIGLAKASDITTNILRGFRLRLDELAPAVDVLAKTVTSSNVDILQLAESFKKVGPVAADFNQSFTDVAAVIGRLGDAGIQAEESGTALRRIFINLQKDVTKADSILRRAGISIRDEAGNFRPLIEIFEEIGEAAISPAEKIDLFAARALAASNVLSIKGEQALRDFATELDDSVGRSAEVAAARLFGFQGNVVKLTSAFESLQIAVAEAGLLDFLTGIVSGLTDFVRALVQLPKPILQAISVLASLAVIAGVVLLQVGLLRLALTAVGFETFGAAALAAGASLKAFGLFFLTNPIGILITALGLATIAMLKFKDETFQVGEAQVTFAGIVSEAWTRISDTISEKAAQASLSIRLLNDDIEAAGDSSSAFDSFGSALASVSTAVIATFRIIGAVLAAFNVRAALGFAGLVQGIVNAFASIPGAIQRVLRGESLFDVGRDIFNSFRAGAFNSFEGFGDQLKNIIETETAGARESVEGFFAGAAQQALPPPERPGAGGLVSGLEGKDAGGGDEVLTPQAVEARRDALDELVSSIDPATAASIEFGESVTTLDEAQAAGLITGTEYSRILKGIAQDGYQAVLAKIDPLIRLEREETRALKELEAAAMNAGIAEEELARAKSIVIMKTDEARLATKEGQEQLSLTQSFTQGASAGFKDFADGLGTTFSTIKDGFSQAFRVGLDALNEFIATGKFNFKAFAETILSLIQEIITQIIILNIVKQFGGSASGTPTQRHGGDIHQSQAGTPFIVGEEGPEVFVPSTAGKVIPNDELGGGGAPQVNVQVVNVDDPKSVIDAIDTKAGEQVILNVISRNANALRSLS